MLLHRELVSGIASNHLILASIDGIEGSIMKTTTSQMLANTLLLPDNPGITRVVEIGITPEILMAVMMMMITITTEIDDGQFDSLVVRPGIGMHSETI